MDPATIATIINAAFGIIDGLRRMGMTTDEINARLAQVDAGGAAITADEVRAMIQSGRDAIQQGRDMQ